MTNPIDRGLLALAAKAAGYQVRWHEQWQCFVHITPFNTDNPPTLAGQRQVWAPFTDDGDALRLAVRLSQLPGGAAILLNSRLDSTGFATIYTNKKVVSTQEHMLADPYAATRRAIVRAAAEIGEGPLKQKTPIPPHTDPNRPSDEYCGMPCMRCDLNREAMRLSINFTARCTCPGGDGSLAWPCPSHPSIPRLSQQEEAAERATFETLIVKGGHGSVERHPGGRYTDNEIQGVWLGYHARSQRSNIEIRNAIDSVRFAERERCASLCDERAQGWDQIKPYKDDSYGYGAKSEARALAAAIRSTSTAPKSQ